MNFQTREENNFTVVSFTLSDEPLKAKDLNNLVPPAVNPRKGVILRGPVWLYRFLVHHYHPTAFIATHDPHLGGAVVVESHSQLQFTGDVIQFKGE